MNCGLALGACLQNDGALALRSYLVEHIWYALAQLDPLHFSKYTFGCMKNDCIESSGACVRLFPGSNLPV